MFADLLLGFALFISYTAVAFVGGGLLLDGGKASGTDFMVVAFVFLALVALALIRIVAAVLINIIVFKPIPLPPVVQKSTQAMLCAVVVDDPSLPYRADA